MSLLPGRSSSGWSWPQLSGSILVTSATPSVYWNFVVSGATRTPIAARWRLGPVGPVGLDRIPERLEALLVGVAVLDDERRDAIGMLEREPIADGRAVIHEIDRIVLDAELRQQAVDDVGIVAERVGERLVIGAALSPKPG